MKLFLICFYSFFIGLTNISQRNDKIKMIIDSNLTFEESVSGLDFPEAIKKNLTLIDVYYYSFDNKLHQGQVVIHKDLADDIKEIFEQIKDEKFPVAKVIPIVKYNWSDSESMKDNNTSAFNYRVIKGTKRLSAHSYGKAIDINPLFNPYVKKTETEPEGAVYNPERTGTITAVSPITIQFKKRGWEWGGNWKLSKDYQHFEKGYSLK